MTTSLAPSLSNKKKSRKLILLSKEFQPQKNHEFVRSYSQLLSKHFTQSNKEKSSLRKSFSSSHGFRTKKNKKLHKPNEDNQYESNHFREDLKNQKDSRDTHVQNKSLHQSIIQGSFNPQMLDSQLSRQKKLELNAETNLKLEKILMTKTQVLEKNSHQNVLLNHKLHQSTHKKQALMNLMENLRLQILKEKKIKAKISTNMGKLMNKIEQVNSGIKKNDEERFFIKEETQLLKKQLFVETKKNNQLKIISQINKEKIKTEKEIISELNSQIERTKAQFFETKTYLNEIKDIYMRETKCLMKVQMHKQQSIKEMNLLCKTVEQSVINAKENPKR